MTKRWLETTPLWEKSVGLFGLILIVITLVSLAVVAIQENGESPSFTFQVMDITQISNGYLVNVEVYNEGDITAENLQMGGSLRIADGEDEHVTLSVDFFPPKVIRNFQFYFSQNPQSGELNFYPLSYQVP